MTDESQNQRAPTTLHTDGLNQWATAHVRCCFNLKPLPNLRDILLLLPDQARFWLKSRADIDYSASTCCCRRRRHRHDEAILLVL